MSLFWICCHIGIGEILGSRMALPWGLVVVISRWGLGSPFSNISLCGVVILVGFRYYNCIKKD